MKVISVQNCDKEKLINFCKENFEDPTMPANSNMDTVGWENKPHTLMHAIYVQERFAEHKRAGYFLLEKDDRYIAASGLYQLDEDPNVCIIATRTYTLKSERANTIQSKFIFPILANKAKDYNYKTLILTFNEYNLWLKRGIERLSTGGTILASKTSDFVQGWKSLEYQVNIKYTKQWVLYKHLDDTYEPNFFETMAKIRCD